jgi:hypothetical protein
MLYGLSLDSLDNFQLIYLGESQDKPEGENLPTILFEEYVRRGWAMGAMVLALNFRRTSVVLALHGYFESVRKDIEEGRPVKTDELDFLLEILKDLREEDRLPLMNLLQIVEGVPSLERLLTRSGGAHTNRQRSALRRFGGEALMLLNGMLDSLAESNVQQVITSPDLPILLRVTFHRKPKADLEVILDGLRVLSRLDARYPTKRYRSGRGSYVEILSTGIISLAGLQLMLYLANGCLIQVTELKARSKALVRRETPQPYQEDALTPRQRVPPVLAGPLRELIRHLWRLDFLSEPDLGGLEAANVKNLEIEGSPEE